MKNNAIFIRTSDKCILVSALLITMVRAIIPNISSIMAAPKIVFPTFEFNLSISLRVSTVILTDVAVSIVPINIFCKNTFELSENDIIPSRLKYDATKNPPNRGTIIPSKAMKKEALPEFFNSTISVSIPAKNINKITPISASCVKNSVSCTIFNIAGPSISPANKAPTT